jgi:hypothetical protein
MTLLGVLAAVLVVLLVAVIILGLVAVVEMARVAATMDVDVGLDVLVTRAVLVDVDVGVLLIARRALAVALNIDFALDTPGGSVALDEDLTLDLLMGVLGRIAMDVDVDVGFLVGVLVRVLLLLLLGPLGLLDRLQSGQVAQDFGKTGVGNVELLLSVLELLLLAEQPVEAVTNTNAASGFDVSTDALRVRRDVLKGAAHVSHGAVHPARLLRVGLEGIVDFADREETTNFIEVGTDATNDAHVDSVGWTDIADSFGLVHELSNLVGTADCRRCSTEGEELSFNHGGGRGSSGELCKR